MKRKEILNYTNFRKNFKFDFVELTKIEDKIYFKNELIQDGDKKIAEGETFINVGYTFKNSQARTLSNLYPIEFKFRGKKVKSIEGVFQGIKYKDKHIQNLVLKYSGVDAYHTRCANSLDFWGKTNKLYWQGKEIIRNSEEYQLFLDELYLSACKNPIYKRCLLASCNKYLLHSIGCENVGETVLTRYEYELRLNSLREYIKKHN